MEKITIKEAGKKKKGGSKKVKSKTLKKLVKAGPYKNYMKGINPYFQTLEDPFNVNGVRIPDMVTVPSSTFKIIDRRTIGWDATHLGCGLYYGGFPVTTAPTPLMGGLIPLQDTGGGTDSFAIGAILQPTTANIIGGTGPFTVATASAMYYSSQWNTPGSPVTNLYASVRLVSAALSVRFTGNTLNNQGKMTAVFVPKNFLRDYYRTNTISLDFMSQLPGALVVPVNSEDGVTICYRPADNQVMEYQNLDVQTTRLSGVYTPQQATPGGFFFFADGLSSTAFGTFQSVFVANYEGIPKTTNFGLVSPSMSISDPISLSHAMNTIQDVPTVVGSTKKAEGHTSANLVGNVPLLAGSNNQVPGQSGSSESKITESHPQQKTSMFETVIKDILPAIKEGVPIVKDLISTIGAI